MVPKRVLVTCHKNNFGAETVVSRALDRAGISHICINRDSIKAGSFKGADFVITVGGDGTFLRTARFVDDQLVLCVASSLESNEGFFAQASKGDFQRKLSLVMDNKFSVLSLTRLESVISYGSKKVFPELAVNEVYVGSRRPYLTARYILKVRGNEEFQKSSGVLVCTAAGSHGWVKSAGGRAMPLSSKRIQYIVREPYFGRLTVPKLVKGVLEPDTSVIVKSLNWDGIVVVDSHHNEYELDEGASITIRDSKKPVRVVRF
ncbi:NAD(+)/NADH kinase [Candidatus Woesearchaeota archaeon]|nr:NAD(+)/NADH kinase [Candidatus Woesearchaeota archaeon]